MQSESKIVLTKKNKAQRVASEMYFLQDHEQVVPKKSWKSIACAAFYGGATLTCTLLLGFVSFHVVDMAENFSSLNVSRLNELINITIALESRLFPPPF